MPQAPSNTVSPLGLVDLAPRAFHKRRHVEKSSESAAAVPAAKEGGVDALNISNAETITHFGMGSIVFPITLPDLEKVLTELGCRHGCCKRKGIRKLLEHILSESELVIPRVGICSQPR